MAAATRTAEATWEGPLTKGSGRFEVGSGALAEQEVTWASRTERSEGKTSPEELLAAAEAACFSMSLSHILGEGGNPPDRLKVNAACTVEQVGDGFKITTMKLDVSGRVDGIDGPAFEQAASQAAEGCPVSGALKGNVEISVDAKLEEE
jgi:osmotically inducible protein OsmC